MSEIQATIIAARIGLIGGFVAAEFRRRQKADELYFQALNFLGGGTQLRNLGFSAIELYWTNRRHRDVSALLLVGAAIYLLTESKQTTAKHEQYNLDRIMALLLSDTQPSVKRAGAYRSLLEVLRLVAGAPGLSGCAIYGYSFSGRRGVQVKSKVRSEWIKGAGKGIGLAPQSWLAPSPRRRANLAAKEAVTVIRAMISDHGSYRRKKLAAREFCRAHHAPVCRRILLWPTECPITTR